MTDRIPVRDDLADVEPYGAPQLDVRVRLNTNETPVPPPPEFESLLRERLAALDLHRYPDRRASALRGRLAEAAGLSPDEVWAANGSNEVLLQLLQAYGGPGRQALVLHPGYSMYPLLCRITLTPTDTADLPDDLVLDAAAAEDLARAHDPAIILVASPNNPTGIAVPLEALRALHDGTRALLVVDEAYVEFGGQSALSLLPELPRLVISRTFSKAYRLAGLRLGYLLASRWVIDDIRKVRLPYHLDAVKQEAALVALDLGDAMVDHIPFITSERERLIAEMSSMGQVQVWPSVANFVLFRPGAGGVFDALLERGVLVRDFSRVRRLEGCLRVTVGTREENDLFLDALRASLGGAGT